MDSEGKKGVNPADGNDGQNNMKKFVDFLNGAKFLDTSEEAERFLELVVGKKSETFLHNFLDTGISPVVLREYFDQHEDDITNAIIKRPKLILSLIKDHLMDLISLSYNSIIMRQLLDKQIEGIKSVADLQVLSSQNVEVQDTVKSLKSSCQLYGNSLEDARNFSTKIDYRQLNLTEIFRKMVDVCVSMLGQVIEREKTISKRDETIAERDKTIAKLNEQISTSNDKFSAATIRAGEYIEKIGKQQQQLEQKQEQFNKANANTSEANNNTKLANERLEQAKQFAIQLADVNEELKERIAALEKENAELKKSNCRRK